VQEVEYKREGAYLNLAVNGLRGKMMWAWTENMKAESMGPVVAKWSQRRVGFLVWDRARGHRGSVYSSLRLQRIEQPPYSPELNPAERVFEYLRAEIEGKIYGTIAAKKDAVEGALEKLAADPEKVKSWTGWQWIRESVEGLVDPDMALE
jgi:transposase